jgi:guanylate kinase
VSRRRGIPFVISAPSGTGKTTVCRRVLEADPDLCFSISHTTRPRRPGETDGVDYHFASDAEFQELVDRGAFLEWAVYNDHRYGTSWAAIEGPLAEGRDVLLEIEIQGARQVRARRADARCIFLLPPSFAVLRQRLEARGTDPPDAIERRLQLAREEFRALLEFDYAVINDDLERSVACVLEIVAAERSGSPTAARRRFAPARVRELSDPGEADTAP